MSFLEELEKGTNLTRTENNAVTNRSTLDPVLDFFALAGAMRNNINDAKDLFNKAINADPVLAVRALFYLRDIRGGQGERKLFRELFKDLMYWRSELAVQLLKFVPEYGRWDDLLAIAPLEVVYGLIAKQLVLDIDSMQHGGTVSLLAKWLPSENASSKESRAKAREIARRLNLSNKDYRIALTELRKKLRLLEQAMSQNDWAEIDYSKLPSQAGRKHSKAFNRHDYERYSDFLSKAVRGEVKINTGTLFTYEVMNSIRHGQFETADALWANLPDYTKGRNALVVADTSGSMTIGIPRPMDISVSLALYFAERNEGPFKGYFMTFSERPQLIQVHGNSLSERLRNIERADWGFNTNLEAVFDVLLDSARRANAKPEDLPAVIYIVSDMEFDQSVTVNDTILNVAKNNFARAGYDLPHIVFWNVSARHKQVPATKYDANVSLFSGVSQSTFKHAVEGKTPVETMLEVLNSERYARIVVE